MQGRQPNRAGESLTPRQKRVLRVACAVLAALVAAVTVWAAANPGSYGRSVHGCVSVTQPSTTGGALVHECGAAAQALCRRAFARHDRISLLARSQCRQAGLSLP